MIATKPVRAALRYYGGKWRISSWVIQHMPEHHSYIEPFGGGASVLLCKHPSPVEVYNDLDEHVVVFFKVLRERPDELIRAIELTPFSRLEVEQALAVRRSGNSSGDELERARRFYVLSRQSQGGASRQHASGWRLARKYSKDNDSLREWLASDHLWQVAARLKQVFIEWDEALKVIARYDNEKALFFIDPPYVTSSRTHDRRGMYQHEMSDEDHRTLAEVLMNIKGMALVSGYPSDLYKELYAGWELVTMQTINNAGKPATECLWLSPQASARQRQLRMEFA